MATLVNHPGMWLSDAAAASLSRFERDFGRLGINSAGRTRAEQLEFLRRWKVGGPENRPPNLYQPALHSPHEEGNALDTSEIARFVANGAKYGWYRNLPTSDPVHFIYDVSRDKMKTSTAGGGTTPIAGDELEVLTTQDKKDIAYEVWAMTLKNVNGQPGQTHFESRATDLLWGLANEQTSIKRQEATMTALNQIGTALAAIGQGSAPTSGVTKAQLDAQTVALTAEIAKLPAATLAAFGLKRV